MPSRKTDGVIIRLTLALHMTFCKRYPQVNAEFLIRLHMLMPKKLVWMEHCELMIFPENNSELDEATYL